MLATLRRGQTRRRVQRVGGRAPLPHTGCGPRENTCAPPPAPPPDGTRETALVKRVMQRRADGDGLKICSREARPDRQQGGGGGGTVSLRVHKDPCRSPRSNAPGTQGSGRERRLLPSKRPQRGAIQAVWGGSPPQTGEAPGPCHSADGLPPPHPALGAATVRHLQRRLRASPSLRCGHL